MYRPLEGLRVIDLTIFLSGPFCTQLLAGLGADVIKIERPGTGDPARFNPPYSDSRGVHFESPDSDSMSLSILKRNRNKRSVTLNLKSEKGKEIFKELVKTADIVTENFSPGTMDRLGLGYDVLQPTNPGLIYCCISGFGQSGPYRDRTAFDIIIQAMSGLMASTGFSDGPPVRVGASIADLIASLYSAVGILAAVRYKERTGKGQIIDVSMLDAAFSFLYDEAKDLYSSMALPDRSGNHRRRLTPFGVYEANDGHVAICIASDNHCHKLYHCMGRDDLIANPNFATMEARWKNAPEVNSTIAEWTRGMSKEQIVSELSGQRLPCGPVVTAEEAARDPQLALREMIVPLEHPLFGKIDAAVNTGFPIKMSESPGRLERPAPLLGQHNEEVYGQLLGLTSEDVAHLKEEGVI